MLQKNLLHSAIISLLVLLFLSGCGEVVAGLVSTPAPTPTPTPEPVLSVTGELHPWDENHPVANKQLVLCQIIGTDIKLPADCALMESSVSADEEGKFEFYNIPSGQYFILYDSGLPDFKITLERWGGERLKLGDAKWLVDQFIETKGDIRCYYPNGIPEELALELAIEGQVNPPEMIRLLNSWSLIYLLCDSPFILAQTTGQNIDIDWDQNYRDVSLSERNAGIFEVPYSTLNRSSVGRRTANTPLIVNVTEGKVSKVNFKVMYFGEQ